VPAAPAPRPVRVLGAVLVRQGARDLGNDRARKNNKRRETGEKLSNTRFKACPTGLGAYIILQVVGCMQLLPDSICWSTGQTTYRLLDFIRRGTADDNELARLVRVPRVDAELEGRLRERDWVRRRFLRNVLRSSSNVQEDAAAQ